MLDALRRGATSWVLKPLLLLLVLAFIVWGVADVFTGVRQGALATVGSREIAVEEYQNTFSTVMNNLARRFGRRPTAEEARLRGLDRAVLEDLINAAALDQHASELNLALPVKTVVGQISSDPTFKGPDGTFDSNAFNAFLRDLGFSERAFIAQKGREEVRQQLTQSLFDDLPVPPALTELVHSWRDAKRKVQHFTIDPQKVVKLGEADEAKLKETYETNKRRFVAPELRHLGVLLLSATEAKKRLEISDEALRKAYDGDRTARVIPEKRKLQQIGFKDKAAAAAARQAIASGKSFLEVAKEAGATEADIDLGEVTKPEMLDQKIAEAAFALPKGEVSQPVDGRFSTVLIRVVDVTPGKERSFEEMKEEIRVKLADSRAGEAIRKLQDAVDDGRSAGKPLKEIAESLKVTYLDIAETDRLGRKADGSVAYEGADAAAILRSGFEGRVGSDSEPIDLADGGYGWVDVINVTAERQKPFDEVKADVKTVWQEIETAKQLTDAATKLVERAQKGEALTKLAGEVAGKLETSKAFNRFGQEANLPDVLVKRTFSLPLGGLASTQSADGKSRTVFRVVEVEKATPITKEQSSQLSGQLRAELQRDVIQAYVTALRDRYGVTVNEPLFRRTTGASTDTP